MADPAFHILILCTGNSARSILAEALFNARGSNRLRAFSAGSRPRDAVHPAALRLLTDRGMDTGRLRSKSWEEFAAPGAVKMDLVITVCDGAAGEACPAWPGAPVRVHWGLPDPAAATGTEETTAAAFEETFRALDTRIGRLLRLPVETFNPAELKRAAEDAHKG